MADAPHDALFRFAFTDPAVVRDHWRASFPPEVVARIRWDTLEHLPGSFVDEDLKQVHSDVLHRVSLEDGAGLWLYVLFEHQSTVDPLMAWRLLRYAVRIWERALAEGGAELPLLVPVVLYRADLVRRTVPGRVRGGAGVRGASPAAVPLPAPGPVRAAGHGAAGSRAAGGGAARVQARG